MNPSVGPGGAHSVPSQKPWGGRDDFGIVWPSGLLGPISKGGSTGSSSRDSSRISGPSGQAGAASSKLPDLRGAPRTSSLRNRRGVLSTGRDAKPDWNVSRGQRRIRENVVDPPANVEMAKRLLESLANLPQVTPSPVYPKIECILVEPPDCVRTP